MHANPCLPFHRVSSLQAHSACVVYNAFHFAENVGSATVLRLQLNDFLFRPAGRSIQAQRTSGAFVSPLFFPEPIAKKPRDSGCSCLRQTQGRRKKSTCQTSRLWIRVPLPLREEMGRDRKSVV